MKRRRRRRRDKINLFYLYIYIYKYKRSEYISLEENSLLLLLLLSRDLIQKKKMEWNRVNQGSSSYLIYPLIISFFKQSVK